MEIAIKQGLIESASLITDGLEVLRSYVEGDLSKPRLLASIGALQDSAHTMQHYLRRIYTGNRIFTIMPYQYMGGWVFDYPEMGIFKEGLISGMPEIIELATEVAGIQQPEYGFLARFSREPFKPEGFAMCLDWQRTEANGNVYSWKEAGHEGWLCPVLLDFFDEPPEHLYVDIAPVQAN